MKFYRFPVLLSIFISLAATAPAFEVKKDLKSGEKIEKSAPVDPHATITLCVMSGRITVRGWDKNELRARSVDVEQLELRRIDKTKDATMPAMRIDVMVFDNSEAPAKRDCEAVGDVEMDVPVGATVQVQTRDGDIHIVGVAAAYAGSQNGDINIEKASKLVEAGSVGGSISLRDSAGRINLSSAGGGVEVVNVRPANDDDSFEVGTVSGDIQLTHVSTRYVVAKTVNGSVIMSGPLAHGGNYAFTTTSGDVNLFLPADASFKLNAKISNKQTIISDFVLRPVEEPPPPPPASPAPKTKPPKEGTPKPPAPKATAPSKSGPVVAPLIVRPTVVASAFVLRRVTVICGDGDSLISVASFGGTVRLKKL